MTQHSAPSRRHESEGLEPGPVVAHVFVSLRKGVFVATACEIVDGLTTASGRWRYAVGANYAETRWGAGGTYSWPRHRIHEVRWLEEDRS
jgi:hypothetical protein